MKKKFLLTGILLAAAVGLTACGNPQKKLPDVSDTNFIENYDDDKETYGNAAVDLLVKKLPKEVNIPGEITGFVVYDIDLGSENKEKATLYVQVASKTDKVEYVGCYEVDMKYSKENKEWKIDEVQKDEHEEYLITPISEPTDEELTYYLADCIYSIYDNDGYYMYIEDPTNMKVNSVEYEINDTCDIVYCTYDVSYDFNYYFYTVSAESKFTITLYAAIGDNPEETYFCWDSSRTPDSKVVSKELDPDTAEQLSEEAILKDFDDYMKTDGYFDSVLSSSMFTEYSIDDVSFSTNSAYTDIYATIEIADGVEMNYDFTMSYSYSDTDGWTIYSMSKYSDTPAFEITDDFFGTYEGTLYDGDDEVGTLRLNLEYKDGDGKIYGTAQYAAKDESFDDAEEVDIEASYYASYWEMDVAFDDYIQIGQYSWEYLSSLYLYADLENGCWSTGTWSSYDVTDLKKVD